MKLHLYCFIVPAALCICTLGAPSLAAQSAQGYVGHGRNAQDTAEMAVVKASDAADYATTQLVRAAIAADASLSADAQAVKILTMNGRVIIAGPVGSDDEKSAVLARAEGVVGAGSVADQMYVPPAADSLIEEQPIEA
jgi:hyperosmotically inducible periplasmic protein